MTEKERYELLKEIVGQAIGQASMCWVKTPEGVFDSTRASKLIEETILKVSKIIYDPNNETLRPIKRPEMQLPECVGFLAFNLTSDKEFRDGYQSNIAMAFKDAWNDFLSGREHWELSEIEKSLIVNNGAAIFLRRFCSETQREVIEIKSKHGL